ncbi:MAG: hypothetical protein WBF93_19955 [Pirellulales bacterium]|nr:hypothetical protein [Pirellulales bacterium]
MLFFRVYQYLGPVILLPLTYWLWWQRFEDHRLVFLILSIPIVTAYIVPGLGTNWLKLWDFQTRWKLGRFRPHHGLLFGSAASMFALICLAPPAEKIDLLEVLRAGFVLGSVLAFWNWLYDIYAVKSGFVRVYNRPYADRLGAEAIVTDYAPVYFGAFGFCFGVIIRLAELWFIQSVQTEPFWPFLIGCHLAATGLPVMAYVANSLARHGESGLRSYEGVSHET